MENRTVTIAFGICFALALAAGVRSQTIGPPPSSGGGGTPCTAAANAIQFNNAGAFGCDSGLTYAGNGGTIAQTYSTSGNIKLQDWKATNVDGSSTAAELTVTAKNGVSEIAVASPGASNGGWALTDWNGNHQLYWGSAASGGGFVDGQWSIQGPNNGSPGDFGPHTDNSLNIGSTSQNVKNVFTYTTTLKGVTIASLPGSPVEGMVAHITDGDASLAWGATAVNSGGGATKYLVWYNGAHWTVAGK